MNFTFKIDGENWETIEASLERIVEKVNNYSSSQLPQKEVCHILSFLQKVTARRKLFTIRLMDSTTPSA